MYEHLECSTKSGDHHDDDDGVHLERKDGQGGKKIHVTFQPVYDKFVWFTCRFCRRNFRKKELLLEHRKKEHAQELVEAAARARDRQERRKKEEESNRRRMEELEKIVELERRRQEENERLRILEEEKLRILEVENEKLRILEEESQKLRILQEEDEKLKILKEEKLTPEHLKQGPKMSTDITPNSISIQKKFTKSSFSHHIRKQIENGSNVFQHSEVNNFEIPISKPAPSFLDDLDDLPILTEQDARQAVTALVTMTPNVAQNLETSDQLLVPISAQGASHDEDELVVGRSESILMKKENIAVPFPLKPLELPNQPPSSVTIDSAPNRSTMAHPPQKAYRFKCEVCSLRYNDMTCLLEHKKQHVTNICENDEEVRRSIFEQPADSFSGGHHDRLDEGRLPLKKRRWSIEDNILPESMANDDEKLSLYKMATSYAKSEVQKILEMVKNYDSGWPKIELRKLNEGTAADNDDGGRRKISIQFNQAFPPPSNLNKSGRLLLSWMDHRIEKFDGRRKIYECAFCGKDFKQAAGPLKVHIRRHTNERNYSCSLPNCAKTFVTRTEQMTHERGPKHSTEIVIKKRHNLLSNVLEPEEKKVEKILKPELRQKWPFHDTTGQLYCICQQISYGRMVGCDNKKCAIEWFHFPCVGLETDPIGVWYCPPCVAARKTKSGDWMVLKEEAEGGAY